MDLAGVLVNDSMMLGDSVSARPILEDHDIPLANSGIVLTRDPFMVNEDGVKRLVSGDRKHLFHAPSSLPIGTEP
jgi:hypothetical protein